MRRHACQSRSVFAFQPMCWLLVAAVCLAVVSDGHGGAGFIRGGAVGGVTIDADGVLSNSTVTDLQELQAAWQAGLEEIPANLDDPADLRFVSLKRLEAEISRHRDALQPLPDAVTYLAGLQRVRYVLVYPEQSDIVLAGPAEGWRIDSLGHAVGATSGRPVLLLDDLMAALRTATTSERTGLSCSIDPTDEGIQRAQRVQRDLRAGMSPEQAAQMLEEALGPQVIIVAGVPATSHFERVMVAADFRMKRLAMDFQPAPIDGMPSYLQLARNSRRASANLLPRWWLAAEYDALHRDADGLAWELRGQGVKCLTEQDAVQASGARTQTGKTEPAAQEWADTFTARFEELAREDSTFGQLRNIMDLAIVGALVAKERLADRAGLAIPRLMGDEMLPRYNAPRHVASQASFVKKRGGGVISTKDGVQMEPG